MNLAVGSSFRRMVIWIIMQFFAGTTPKERAEPTCNTLALISKIKYFGSNPNSIPPKKFM